jgi:hypothetical protein
MIDMRVLRVSELRKNKVYSRISSAPREGSRIRALYDAFMTGEEVTPKLYCKSKDVPRSLDHLQDFYGLEIVRVRVGVYKMR